jgi:hypothetical protein
MSAGPMNNIRPGTIQKAQFSERSKNDVQKPTAMFNQSIICFKKISYVTVDTSSVRVYVCVCVSMLLCI